MAFQNVKHELLTPSDGEDTLSQSSEPLRKVGFPSILARAGPRSVLKTPTGRNSREISEILSDVRRITSSLGVFGVLNCQVPSDSWMIF